MKRLTILLLAGLALVALPLFAQEKEKPKESTQSMAPPKPLNDDLCKWMVGEWEGSTQSPMGKSKDWSKYEMGLDKQFVMMQATSKMTEATPEQKKMAAEMYGMSMQDVEKMMGMTYKGMGPLTINPMTGEFTGYWFDNWRGVYKGTGKRDGNKLAISWEGPMGTEVRTTEKVSDDKMVITLKSTDPKGHVMEGKTELTRKKAAGKM